MFPYSSVSRYRYRQCSDRHIPTASDGLERTGPGSEAPQTHCAPPWDLCMNLMPSKWWWYILLCPWREISLTVFLEIFKPKPAIKLFFGWDPLTPRQGLTLSSFVFLMRWIFFFLLCICSSQWASRPNFGTIHTDDVFVLVIPQLWS